MGVKSKESVLNAGAQRSVFSSVSLLLIVHSLPFTFHGKTERGKEMTTESVLSIGQEAIQTILLVAGPMLGLSLLVGLCVSAFQAMTQINEMTLTFLPKVATMFVVLLVTFPWMVEILVGFMTGVWARIPEFAQ